MADEEAVLDSGISPVQSPLVQVSFQRNVNRRKKYLEGEPKILGVTQIGLSMYQILCVSVFLSKELCLLGTAIAFFITSLLILIAGSLAIAAQNLNLPTLRGCLGMQIVACLASITNMVCCLFQMETMIIYCWHYDYDNNSLHIGETCHRIESTQSHFYAENLVINVTLLAISATLASYCCKVAACCAPDPKVPVITVQAPPVQQ